VAFALRSSIVSFILLATFAFGNVPAHPIAIITAFGGGVSIAFIWG